MATDSMPAPLRRALLAWFREWTRREFNIARGSYGSPGLSRTRMTPELRRAWDYHEHEGLELYERALVFIKSLRSERRASRRAARRPR